MRKTPVQVNIILAWKMSEDYHIVTRRRKLEGETKTNMTHSSMTNSGEVHSSEKEDNESKALLSKSKANESAGGKEKAIKVKAPEQPSSGFSLLALAIVSCQITCEVGKQVSNYSVRYFNGGVYPIPQTAIVALSEVIKLLTTVLRSKGSIPSFSPSNLRSSLRFLLPSVLYALNNNIYLVGLTMVPPPIWLILCSVRTAITASVYKFILKRDLTKWQFFGAFLIVSSIIVTKLPDLLNTKGQANDVPILAVVLAMFVSCNSVTAAVYTEKLFKNKDQNKGGRSETFLEQQFWLYFYGILVASVVHLISSGGSYYGPSNLIEDFGKIFVESPSVFWLLAAALFTGSIGGLVVASILKYLDNIVKEYSGSVANIMTALVSAYLFPDKFTFTPFVLVSLTLLLTGIFIYETKKAKAPK